jgi:hypothetical protein
MESASASVWVGRVSSGVAIAFLLFDAAGKLLRMPAVIEWTVKLGYPESTVFPIGLALLFGVVLYAIPRTSVLGAVYLAAYLGGAVATHYRVGSPFASQVLFPVYVAALVWGGLVLRSPHIRRLLLGGVHQPTGEIR